MGLNKQLLIFVNIVFRLFKLKQKSVFRFHWLNCNVTLVILYFMPFCLPQISAVTSKLPFSFTHVVWIWFDTLCSQLPTLARQISNCSFKNKPNIVLWFIIINSIYHQLRITNKWACNVLNWNHSFIWKAKTEGILPKLATCNKSGNKTSNHMWAEYDWRDGKGEKHKSFKGEQ